MSRERDSLVVCGQCGRAHRWRPLARGKTIGYRKLERFEPTPVRRVRVVVEDAVADPRPLRIGLYAGG